MMMDYISDNVVFLEVCPIFASCCSFAYHFWF